MSAYHIAIPMATNTDRILAAAAEALQKTGVIKWNIVNTPNAPPLLSELEKSLEVIRMRIGTLQEIKEQQWKDLGRPMCVHAQANLIAIAEICNALDKGIWLKTEDCQLVLRIRVLTSGLKERRITAHLMTLLTLQHSLDLLSGTANT